MPTRDTLWPNGTPNWVDCSFDDLHRARDFYGKLFGWETHEGPAEAGGYTMCLKHGRPAAALSPRMSEGSFGWCTYFATDDVDGTAAHAVDAGGRLLFEPQDVMEAGRFALVADPEGAVFGLWQGRASLGFEIVNEPGAIGWNDLMTRDLGDAKRFYGAVFGYDFSAMGDDYVTFSLTPGGAPVGGMHAAGELPDDAPASWLPHFVVADRDSTVAIVEELDGEVLMSFDTPFGPEATIRGPEGEVFNVIAFVEDEHVGTSAS